jgi:hypothetical protein
MGKAEDTPGPQRAISDTTPWRLRPATIVAIILASFGIGGAWAAVGFVQFSHAQRLDDFKRGQDELRAWAREFDRRMDRVEAALGVRAPVADRTRGDSPAAP